MKHPFFENSRKSAADYLERSINADGSFVYRRHAISGREVGRKYNVLRHAGSVFALLQCAAMDNGLPTSAALLRALQFQSGLLNEVEVSGKRYTALVSGDAVKLGGVALCLVSFVAALSLNPRVVDTEVAKRLAEYILSQQDADGKFRSKLHVNNTPSNFESLYYPGEAILALVFAYRYFRIDRYLKGAILGTQYLTARYNLLTDSQLPHDHWFVIAVLALDNFWTDFNTRNIVVRMGCLISESAIVHKDRGIAFWGKDARLCPAATRAEALGAAFEVAIRCRRYENAFLFLKRLEQAVAFCLTHLITPDDTIDGKFDPRAIGGIVHSLSKPIIRIDYVQHTVGALNALLRSRTLL